MTQDVYKRRLSIASFCPSLLDNKHSFNFISATTATRTSPRSNHHTLSPKDIQKNTTPTAIMTASTCCRKGENTCVCGKSNSASSS